MPGGMTTGGWPFWSKPGKYRRWKTNLLTLLGIVCVLGLLMGLTHLITIWASIRH
jgi:antibiotic biosynthesis monooxygenase (ABM) superfamily enzyme